MKRPFARYTPTVVVVPPSYPAGGATGSGRPRKAMEPSEVTMSVRLTRAQSDRLGVIARRNQVSRGDVMREAFCRMVGL